jgi:hypothetical protein
MRAIWPRVRSMLVVVGAVVGMVVVAAVGVLAVTLTVRLLLDVLPAFDDERFWDLAYDLAHEQGFAVGIVAGLYLLGAVVTRWNLIARPVRSSIEGSMIAIETKARQCASPDVVERIDDIHRIARNRLNRERWVDRVLWRGAPEVEALQRINATEELLIPSLSPATVRAELIVTSARLGALTRPDAKALVATIKSTLAATPTAAGESKLLDFQRALLVAGASMLRDTIETRNELKWHRKALWLVVTGLVLAVVVTEVHGHAVILVGGATGAFLSRLWRALRSKATPRDYLQNWTTLILGPVAGALAGYFGVTLVRLLSDLDLIGETLQPLVTGSDTSNAILALAFMLGFSERLLDRLVEQAEEAVRAPRTNGAGGGPDPAAVDVAVAAGAVAVVDEPVEAPLDAVDTELLALFDAAKPGRAQLLVEASMLRQSDNGSKPGDPEEHA